jgi:hypothetical protein
MLLLPKRSTHGGGASVSFVSPTIPCIVRAQPADMLSVARTNSEIAHTSRQKTLPMRAVGLSLLRRRTARATRSGS